VDLMKMQPSDDLWLVNPKGRTVTMTKDVAIRCGAVQQTIKKGVVLREVLGYQWTPATDAEIAAWKAKHVRRALNMPATEPGPPMPKTGK
jgi:hypothetical protein